jgi:D-cysteine desulfhydrase
MKNIPRLRLAHLPTPFHRLDRLSAELGRSIWVKRDDMTGGPTTGNKIRKLEFTLAEAKAQGANVLVTCGGIQSNHCRATAILGRQLGFDVHLLLRGEKPSEADGNLFLDKLAGAEISYFSPRYYQAHLDFIVEETCDTYRKQAKKPYFITTGASDEVGVWGYVEAAGELLNDFSRNKIDPQAIVIATGSGGTQAGLTVGMHRASSNIPVIGMAVCDDSQWFENKIKQDLSSWAQRYEQDLDVQSLDIRVNDRYIGPGYAKAERPIFQVIEKLLQTEALLLDPVYTGKAFYGMLKEAKSGELAGQGDLVFVHTGGAFGLMAQRRESLQQINGKSGEH